MNSRRSFLRDSIATLAAAWLTLDGREVAAAAAEARRAARSQVAPPAAYLTPLETAVVEAVAAQIIPSGTTPGAREAGVVFFVDRALATFLAHTAERFRAQLSDFHEACRRAHPGVDSFASLSHEQQLAWLSAVERTPFFDSMRRMTVLGMFSLPAYGGNRDCVGWQLLGFEDRHVFEPPFGHYDRDYPGFVPEPLAT